MTFSIIRWSSNRWIFLDRYSIILTIIILMKATDIEIQLRNYKVREGWLIKRSRFRKEWRERWVVLTMNFLFCFEANNCKELTQVIDLKEVQAYRSYLKKNQQIFSSGLILLTKSKEFVFSARSLIQKWSWIVTIERLMDYKQKGASEYNNIDQIRTKGFDSQDQFLLKRKAFIRDSTYKTLSLEEQENRNLIQADEILKRLIQKQQEMTKKQDDLLLKEKYIQRSQILEQHFTEQLTYLNLKIENLQKQISKIKQEKRQQLEVDDDETEDKHGGLKDRQYSEIDRFNRLKIIQHMLQELKIGPQYSQLTPILEFLFKMTELRRYGFQQSIIYSIANSKNRQHIITLVIQFFQRLNPCHIKYINRAEIFLICLLSENSTCKISPEHLLSIQTMVYGWSNLFSSNIRADLLQKTVELYSLIYEQKEPFDLQKISKNISYLEVLIDKENKNLVTKIKNLIDRIN